MIAAVLVYAAGILLLLTGGSDQYWVIPRRPIEPGRRLCNACLFFLKNNAGPSGYHLASRHTDSRTCENKTRPSYPAVCTARCTEALALN
jgi:hypothetical protein